MSGEPAPSKKATDPVTNAPTVSKRLLRDVETLCQDPPTGILVEPEHNDMRKLHVLIFGPDGTPYQGGFFYFMVECPTNYPFNPPAVKLLTTDAGGVRFNPNLYADGKVCLSILGTWHGPQWSPAQTMASCLVSIQSIMNEQPYHNEPGFAKEHNAGDSSRYNEVIRHETLRVAVCGMLEGETGLNVPTAFRDAMVEHFARQYEYYEEVAVKGMDAEGGNMRDPFGENCGVFHYGDILRRLRALKKNNCGGHL